MVDKKKKSPSISSSLGMKENLIVDDDDPTFCLCYSQTGHLAKNCLLSVNIVNSAPGHKSEDCRYLFRFKLG